LKAYKIFVAGVLLALVTGCSKDDSPTSSGRVFSGITERDEWGDTLSVDPDDWVILGGFAPSAGGKTALLPQFRNGKRLNLPEISVSDDVLDWAIGAFPNPFIPGAGRLLIELVLPTEAQVEIHAEDESGEWNVVIMDAMLPKGLHLISWSGKDASGEDLPDGIYRIFFQSGLVHSYGDVQIYLSGEPTPSTQAEYVLYAGQNYFYEEYVDFSYDVATTFGPDGELGGGDVLTQPVSLWDSWDFADRFLWLPVFMSYDLNTADPYQYYYLLAYKHFQFGAGWPDAGDTGVVDPEDPQWQKSNSFHNTYLDLYPFEEGP